MLLSKKTFSVMAAVEFLPVEGTYRPGLDMILFDGFEELLDPQAMDFFLGECRGGGFPLLPEGGTEGLGDEFLELESTESSGGFDFPEKGVRKINGRSHGQTVCFYAFVSS